MREKLNDNPIAQVAVVAVLLLAAAVFLLGKMGGGSEEGEESAASSEPVAVASAELEPGATPQLPPPGSGPGALPPAPRAVVSAFEADDTVVLLFVRRGGIDDRLVQDAAQRLRSFPRVVTFVVSTDEIAHYVSIAQGVDLNRVPALVVVRPRRLDQGTPSASVQYGFQSAESIVQAVVDAGYHGGTLPYHP